MVPALRWSRYLRAHKVVRHALVPPVHRKSVG